MHLQIEGLKIWLADDYIDFRKSINGLLALISDQASANPKRDIFVFYNRKRDKLKLLGWHRNGYTMIYKSLDKGKFKVKVDQSSFSLTSQQLSWLLAGLDWLLMSSCSGDEEFSDFY